jgi:hypothetical protein
MALIVASMSAEIIIGILSLILAVIGVDYARKTFKKDHIDKPQEEKLHLLAQFKATQILSRQACEVVHKFIVYYNAFDKEVWPGQGITYRTYLDELRKPNEEGNLSDAAYENLKQREMPSITIQSHVKSLEQQYEALNLTYQEFRIKTQNF